MYRNTKPLCWVIGINIVLWVIITSKTNSQEKEIICGYQRQRQKKGKLDKSGQKVQISSYKIKIFSQFFVCMFPFIYVINLYGHFPEENTSFIKYKWHKFTIIKILRFLNTVTLSRLGSIIGATDIYGQV